MPSTAGGSAVVGGRVTDALVAKGRLSSRLFVPAIAVALAGVVFIPGTISKTFVISIPLFLAAGFCIVAPGLLRHPAVRAATDLGGAAHVRGTPARCTIAPAMRPTRCCRHRPAPDGR